MQRTGHRPETAVNSSQTSDATLSPKTLNIGFRDYVLNVSVHQQSYS